MRILSVVRQHYYGTNEREPCSYFFVLPLRRMGHEVETFDHFEAFRAHGRQAATADLLKRIRPGSYDLVLYQTSGDEPVETSALRGPASRTCIVAWNSDDDWQWNATKRLASHFTYMVTTYPHIHEENRAQYPNLLLSQWGCLGEFSDFKRKKDIDFSFVGSVYGSRNAPCRYLWRRAGMQCFGRGARMMRAGIPYFRGAFRLPWLAGEPLQFEGVYGIWNRSRISYTPMTGGPKGEVLSIKARVFEMGLSGTLMLCEHSPNLECYYEPGRECVTFGTVEECAEKTRWYLAHERERLRIVTRYRERTLREHMWQRRFRALFALMGFKDRQVLCAVTG